MKHTWFNIDYVIMYIEKKSPQISNVETHYTHESELRIQMLEDLKRTLADLLNHEREIRDSL